MSSKYLLAFGLFASVVFGACTPQTASDETPAEETMEPTITQEVVEDSETSDSMMESREITMDMNNFSFSQETITARPGDTITVNLTNSEGMHDFVIDELEVQSEVIQAGEETSVTFTIPEDVAAGTEYAYYCSIGQHRANGMEGMLVIE